MRSKNNRSKNNLSKNNLSKKNNRSRNNRYTNVVLPSKPSFALKLAAFMLQGVKTPIVFDKEHGFSNKHHEVFGVLIFLHMNIKENEFVNLLNNGKLPIINNLSSMCVKRRMNTILKQLDFNCKNQSNSALIALNKGIVDSINNRYYIRANGKSKAKDLLKFMTWQVQNKLIPSNSIKWGQ